jgi:sterol desaturase/sphingolipid hydroxylase (fatty acid hydroxylase superfamily)
MVGWTAARGAVESPGVYFQPQSRREPRIRLFRSDLLETLTVIHPAVVVVVWAPIIAWFLADGWSSRATTGMTPDDLLLAHLAGLLAWTLVEYCMHRFVFHFSPRNPPPWLHRLIFLFHGIHHVQPWDKSRLVMPPAVSVPLALLFYALFAWLLGSVCGAPGWLSPLFGAFLAGYLAYDLLHYATHHLPLDSSVGRWLKRHHLLHHHVTPDDRFGVTSPLWDVMLRTLPRDEEREARTG